VVIDGQDKLQDNSKVVANAAPVGASSQPAAQSNAKPNNPATPRSGEKSR